MSEWIQTHSGKKFYPFDPKPDDIIIEDIAHALSQQCRFSGHTHKFYSIAQHSIYVARRVPTVYRRTALLHDAAEAYLLDIPTPIKRMLPEYKKAEDRLLEMIFEKFGCMWPIPDEVRIADAKALATEAYWLMRADLAEWQLKEEPDLNVSFILEDPKDIKAKFLSTLAMT